MNQPDSDTNISESNIETSWYEEGYDEISAEYEPAEEDGEEFPAALYELRVRSYLFAAALSILAVVLSIAFKNISYCALCLIGICLFVKAYCIKKQFFNGEIIEDILVCQSVRKSALKNSVTVTFLSEEDNRLVQFVVSGRKNTDVFVPGGTYLCYYNKNSSKTLMTYMQVK